MKKLLFVLFTSIMLLSVTGCMRTIKDTLGLQHIYVNVREDGFTLCIEHADLERHKYSVKLLPIDAPDMTCNGDVKYDGSMGKYRMRVAIGDVDITQKLRQTYGLDQVHEISTVNGATLKMKVVIPDDAMVFVYVGSDKPLLAEECDYKFMKSPIGVLKIPVGIE